MFSEPARLVSSFRKVAKSASFAGSRITFFHTTPYFYCTTATMIHAMRTIETENVKLMFGKPRSRALIVSFAHMDYDWNVDTFWGEEALRKAGFDTVGLVCKSNCWFPAEEIDRLSKHIQERSKYYDKIIHYGASMGAYAAVKYSRLFGADISLAFSPQFSIDPMDTRGYDHRLSHNFQPGLNRGMSVKSHDLSGDIYLFCDHSVTEDKWNCEKIASMQTADCNINIINLLNLGHESVDVFSGTELIAKLLNLCLDGDITSILRFSSESRRISERRIFNLLMKLRKRSPDLANKMFKAHADRFHPYWRDQWPVETL